MGRLFTSKRTSTASAWRVAMATTVPFQVQCRSSPLQRSATWKSSYMQLAYRSGAVRASARLTSLVTPCPSVLVTPVSAIPEIKAAAASFAADELGRGTAYHADHRYHF